MLILGIESSCDETGFALYESNAGLLGHVLHSQNTIHSEYGGIVPELASRDHVRRALPLLKSLFDITNIRFESIHVIAYTAGPGLIGSLLVGASIANGLAFALNRPVIPIHHLEGHLLSPMLEENPPTFPFIALLVSGGHTQLIRVDDLDRYTMLGETLDDAAGEAFDKVARLLDLGYPGGPMVSALAEQGRSGVALPRPMRHSGDLNFSFSGLKTAVLTQVQKAKHDKRFSLSCRADIALGFVESIVDVLAEKTLSALKKTGLERLVVVGGVGANQQLRNRLNVVAAREGFKIHYPSPELCTDNGAMIALAGALRIFRWPEQATRDYRYQVMPRWRLIEKEEN